MKSIVVVSSRTGNTLKVAGTVAYALDEKMEAVKVEENPDVSDYDLVVVGTWIDRGNADKKAADFIKSLRNKKVAIFATLGAYPDSEHAQKCIENIVAQFDESCEVVGSFICQGAVSQKMVDMMQRMFPEGHPHAMNEARIKRLAGGKTHPDDNDLQNAREYFMTLKNRLES
ncbi:flavodoxin family protein [uncultured Anaerovibrio sp.]|uniref:flavodoxin family protein n=1 Tax=uncultured Anaerovibrio sp. TaxID=361586 RepID=UPI0025CE82B3|nr:flavodoxin family protein [uncultured Anaerovibrio sp.]